ncbi:MAG: hypothetical protein AAGC92_12755 [Pseudomonadota bacterium]
MSIRIEPYMHAHPVPVRVGGYASNPARGTAPRYAGPDGSTHWQVEARRGGGRLRTLYFQEEVFDIIPCARIHANTHDVPVYGATLSELRLINHTLKLVPPAHLARLIQRKPEGINVASTSGRAGSLSYTGGLNAMADDAETWHFNERLGLILTHGALWRHRGMGICPALIHEIGHVMTHRPPLISYRPFPQTRAEALAGTRVSRNPGRLEALCNCYMYMICYGAEAPAVHAFGAGGRHQRLQRDALTRQAMRATPAFSTALDTRWRTRFDER